MKSRNIVTAILLLIVAAAVVRIVVGGRGESPAEGDYALETASTPAPRDGVVAYYFHRTQRCVTCRNIEDTARETLRGQLTDAMSEGRLHWLTRNLDDEAHAHFVDDFELVASSLVLVEYRDGKVTRFQDLDKVWELIGDVPAFSEYVAESTRSFLAEG